MATAARPLHLIYGLAELRRSRKCSYVIEGICSRGPDCEFKHGSSDSFLDVSADIGSDGEHECVLTSIRVHMDSSSLGIVNGPVQRNLQKSII